VDAPQRIERVLRAMPPRLLQDYLEDLGGKVLSPGVVEGAGWQAHVEKIEDHQVGSIRVGQVRLVLEGETQVLESLMPQLEIKMMRAGA
jgi:hypothetical protein